MDGQVQGGAPDANPGRPWRSVRYHACGLAVVKEDTGNFVVVVLPPNGEAIELELHPDAALKIGRALSAPSVVIPTQATQEG